MIQHYLKIAFRNIFKHRTQSIISILGLMGGMVCFSVCTYFAREVNRGDSEFPEYHRMAKLFVPKSMYNNDLDIYKEREAFIAELEEFSTHTFDEIEYTATYSNEQLYTLEFDEETSAPQTFRTRAIYTNSHFIRAYPSKFLEGNAQLYADNPNGAIVSASFAQRISPNESVMGRSFVLRFASRYPLKHPQRYTIVGVTEDYMPYTSFGVAPPEVLLRNDRVLDHATFILKPHTHTTHINEKLNVMRPYGEGAWIENNTKMYYVDEMRIPFLPMVIISFISFLVLLVGIINFTSFTVGAFLNRNRELSLRRTLGGSFRHLAILLCTELSIIVTSAVLLSMALCELLTPYFHSLLPHTDGIREILQVNVNFLLVHQLQYGICLLLGCSAVSVVIAYRISKNRSLANARRGTKTGSRHKLRNTMLGVQFFICLLFMYATGAVVQVFMTIYHTYEQRSTTPNDEDIPLNLSLQEDYMLQIHSAEIIDSLARKEWCTDISYYTMRWTEMYKSNGDMISLLTYFVGAGYFERNHIPLISKETESDGYFCFINRTLQDYLAKDSIYSTLRVNKDTSYPITGVVEYNTGKRHPSPVAFIAQTNEKPNYIQLSIKSDADKQIVKKDIYAIVTPYMPDGTEYHFLLPGEKRGTEDFFALYIIFTAFFSAAIICILITVLGLYGAITLDTNRRQKEVAIRKINGAKSATILWLFGKLYIALYVCAAILSTLITYVIFMLFDNGNEMYYNYQNPIFYSTILLIAAAIILITIIYRLRHIARLNPVECLKTE